MRSYNNLYEPILQDDYIRECFKDAAKKKSKRRDVKKILENLDTEVGILKGAGKLIQPIHHNRSKLTYCKMMDNLLILVMWFQYPPCLMAIIFIYDTFLNWKMLRRKWASPRSESWSHALHLTMTQGHVKSCGVQVYGERRLKVQWGWFGREEKAFR